MRGHGVLFVEEKDGKRLSLVPVGTDGGKSQTPTPFPQSLAPNGETNNLHYLDLDLDLGQVLRSGDRIEF